MIEDEISQVQQMHTMGLVIKLVVKWLPVLAEQSVH